MSLLPVWIPLGIAVAAGLTIVGLLLADRRDDRNGRS